MGEGGAANPPSLEYLMSLGKVWQVGSRVVELGEKYLFMSPITLDNLYLHPCLAGAVLVGCVTMSWLGG